MRTLTDVLDGDSDLWAAAVQAVLLAAFFVPGQPAWAGPVLLSLSATHGVHAGDLVVVALWLAVLAAAVQRGLVRDLLDVLAPVAGTRRGTGGVRLAA